MLRHRTWAAKHPTDEPRRPGRPSFLPALEAAGMFALIMLDIWFIQPHFRPAWLGLVALAVASHALRGETPGSLGFRTARLRECFIGVTPLLLGIAALALVLGLTFGTVRSVTPGRCATFLAYYCVWGLFQQYVLNGYFVNRFAAAAPGGRLRFVPVVAAACFAAAHAPNWFLAGVTLVAGWLCAHFYLKYRNLYPLGLAHGLLGSVLFLTVPDSVSQHFYIGPGALKWQRAHRAEPARPLTCLAALAPGAPANARDHPFASGCETDDTGAVTTGANRRGRSPQ